MMTLLKDSNFQQHSDRQDNDEDGLKKINDRKRDGQKWTEILSQSQLRAR